MAINPVTDNGEKLFNKMESFAASLLESKQIEFAFSVEPSFLKEDFIITVRQNLLLIFKEVINNSLKHSGAKKVWADVIKQNNLLIMRITDNGKGIDEDKRGQGNGLRNIHSRAAELNGTANISSNANGTLVEVRIPVR